MKTKITVLLLACFVSTNLCFAQDELTQECMEKTSIFDTYVKQKKYEEAYNPWKEVRSKCPKYSRAIYVRGEDILNYKIKNAIGAEKVNYIKDLMLLNEEYNANFASKFSKGKMLTANAEIAYQYKEDLGKSDLDIYNMYDEIYKTDKENFTNAKGLYTYFSLIVDLFDANQKSAQSMFDKYDDVIEVIENTVEDFTTKLNMYAAKEEAGETLSKKELKYKEYYEDSIEAFEDKVVPSMDKKLGDRANCAVLIPLYEKNFDANKNNPVWLQRAMNRMYAKGCKEDPLFLKLVQQKNTIEPSADTSFYLYLLTGEQQYFNQTIELETNPIKKAKLYNKIAQDFKSKGSYGKARNYYQEALKLNPSDGRPYLAIANMYAKSANNCGETSFEKRAVFWAAANMADRAGRVDGRLKSAASQTAANYRAKAPSTADIFNSGKSGQTIRIGCWIGTSVTVPKI